MAKQTINIGTSANDGTGTTIRAGGDLINDNFNEIYTELGDGTTLALASKSITFTNKSLDGSTNTFSNIPGSALTNALPSFLAGMNAFKSGKNLIDNVEGSLEKKERGS